MKKAEFLKIVRKQIHYVFARNDIEKELDQHLQDSIEDLLAEGYSEEEAEKQAVLQMGNPVEIGQQLNKEHNSIQGYAYFVTKILVLLLLLPIVFKCMSFAIQWCGLIKPVVVKDSEAVYAVNKTIKLPTHYLKIDNICVQANKKRYLTYRTGMKLSKYRRVSEYRSFIFLDEDGNQFGDYIQTKKNKFGAKGCIEIPDSCAEIIYVVGENEEQWEIILGDYLYESK